MKTQWYHILALAVVIAVLVVFLYIVRSVLPPFLIAFAIAWLLDPLLDRMQSRGCPRVLAVSAVYLIFLAAFVIGLIFLVPAVVDQAKQLAQDTPTYSSQFKTFAAGFMEEHHSLLLKLKLPTTLEEGFAKYGSSAASAVTSGIQLMSNWIVANLSKALWIILIPLIAFYLLSDLDRIRKKSVLLIPAPWRARATQVLSRMGTVFSSYVRGLTVVCLLYGVTSTVVLMIAGVRYGIILGLLAGVLYAVPYIGAFLITILVFLVVLATQGLGHAIVMAGIQVLLNQVIFDMVITPKILGKSVGLHPVLSIFALLAGGQLFGLVGMVLAVPVAASVQEVVFEFVPELRPEPAKKKPKREFSLFGKRKKKAKKK
jgi:predicted PurR-regulated permease PerM